MALCITGHWINSSKRRSLLAFEINDISIVDRSRLEIMRQFYNCEQISIPRALSSHEINDYSSQRTPIVSDSRQSSFDDSIPTPTVKSQFDFTSNARFVKNRKASVSLDRLFS